MMILARMLQKKRINQSELARAVGCTPQTISRIIAGLRMPSPDLASRIANATDTTPIITNGRIVFKRKGG